MKKRILFLVALCLLLLTRASAQNYKIQTDSIVEAMTDKDMKNWKIPDYQICFDSLLNYVDHIYGGGTESVGTMSRWVSVPVSGSDDQLRKTTSHIISKLSRFPHLQEYREHIDDGTSLRGRYIVKLRPERGDTSVYALLKYDRQLLILKISCNEALRIPSGTSVSTTSSNEEELSVWRMLRDEFYFNCKYTNNTAQIKYTFFNYKPSGKWSFTTTPAPRTGSEVKGEILRINDENGFWLSRIRKQMELAGKEKGTINGVFQNKNQVARDDTCHYYYACRTLSNGLSEFIGGSHEDSITYLIRATSEDPGLCMHAWGKFNFMSEEESKAEVSKNRVFFGVWVHDEVTDKLLNTAKLSILDDDGKVVNTDEPYVHTVTRWGEEYRYICYALRREHYIIKVEADGYEPAYGELTIKPDQSGEQIHIYIKPKNK